MASGDPEVTPERREMLAEKGRRLYGKYCGTGGRVRANLHLTWRFRQV